MPLNPDVTLNLLAIQEMDIQWRWMKVGKMFFNHTQHSSIDKAFRQHFLNTVWLIPSEILMHLKLLLTHATKHDIFQLSSPATICMLQFKLRLFCWLFKDCECYDISTNRVAEIYMDRTLEMTSSIHKNSRIHDIVYSVNLNINIYWQ